ncbi:hypothetical protein GSI_00251 [Ganoderma sinense ZZ0214-1]|uniref:Uncharacterized protein n=1 Tax=Ganoderma sinense ZZ0214-1 TaxID=1077348 RepID=A0A2G8SS41_9APHY|nr:hypothetical protein GSI_00251 [Ganoderma sinense ZZ0214-1]
MLLSPDTSSLSLATSPAILSPNSASPQVDESAELRSHIEAPISESLSNTTQSSDSDSESASSISTSSIPSLVTVLSYTQAHVESDDDGQEHVSLGDWQDSNESSEDEYLASAPLAQRTPGDPLPPRPTRVHIRFYYTFPEFYPAGLRHSVEMEEKFLLHVYSATGASGEVVDLPLVLATHQARSPAVWNTYWANIVNSQLYAELKPEQREFLHGATKILQFYATPSPQAMETWDEFSRMLCTAGLLQFRYPHISGDVLLAVLIEWAHAGIPDAFLA